MSQEEEVKLKDLVTEALEKNGVLAKIRAQLRANIFMTLENEKGQNNNNVQLNEALSTHDGVLSLLLVQELLEYYSLKQTSSVYRAETGHGTTYVYKGRQALLHSFKCARVSDRCDLPVLVQLIKVVFKLLKCTHFEDGSAHFDCAHEKSSNESETSPKNGAQNNTFVVNSGRSDNYDLSFTSDSESSAIGEDKNRLFLQLNLNNSLENDTHSKDSECGGFSRKDNENASIFSVVESEVSETVKTVSGIDETNIKSSESKKSVESSRESEDCLNSQSINKRHSNKNGRHRRDVNIQASNDSSRSDDSVSEEIVQAFENGEEHDLVSISEIDSHSVSCDVQSSRSVDLQSPPPNLLDLTIPESPTTKLKVAEEINSLKLQSNHKGDVKKTKDSQRSSKISNKTKDNEQLNEVPNSNSNIGGVDFDDLRLSDKNVIDKNRSNMEEGGKTGLSSLADLPSLTKSSKNLPSYGTKPNAHSKMVQSMPKGIIVDSFSNAMVNISREWTDS